MSIVDQLKQSISIEDLINKLGLNLGLKDKANKKVGNCITGHESNSGECFHIIGEEGYFCHSCGIKGNIFSLLEEVKGLEFKEALIFLIDNFRPDLKQQKNQYKQSKKNSYTDYQSSFLYEELYKYGKKLLYEKEGEEALKYLTEERGYSLDNLKKTEWFYLPKDKEARAYLLKTLSDTGEETKKFIKGEWIEKKFRGLSLQGYSGDSFRLAFPYRDRYGNIRGYIKRATAPKGIKIKDREGVRYDSTTGLSKKDLFNLWRYKKGAELLIVEGYPDALFFHTLNINCVAVGQGAVSETHIEGLKAKAITKVTLSLDNDGKEKGEKHTETAIELLLQNDIKVFVLPPRSLGQYKDLDEYFRGEGEEELKLLLKKKVIPSYTYKLSLILEKYSEIQNREGSFTPLHIDTLLSEVVALASSISSPIEKDLLLKTFLGVEAIKSLGVSKESIEATVEKITYNREKEVKNKALSSLIKSMEKKQKEGELNSALDLAEEQIREIRIEEGGNLIKAYSFDNYLQDMESSTPAMKTGIASIDNFARIPIGVITLIAGKPSHGKTTVMYNLLLSMEKEHSSKKFYFFTYEEPKEFILTKILNNIIGGITPDLDSYNDYKDLKTNIDFLKQYLRDRRTDIQPIEEGKALLKQLLEENRIEVIGERYSVEELSKIIYFLASKEEIGAIFIDYIQKIPATTKTQDMRTKIAHISNTILATANNTKLPIILGAQFNREGANRAKPLLSDLKEASNLEEDASLVLRVYNQAKDLEATEGTSIPRETQIEITALKNRDGSLGSTSLNFDTHIGVIKENEVLSF